MRIQDARAVVTGGASGLGHAVARHVVAGGGKVVLLDVQEGPGQAAAAALGASAGFVRCDVTSEAEVNAAMEAAGRRMGGLNLLVNCAGVNLRPPMAEIDEQTWDTTMAVNLEAPYLLGQRFGPGMAERGFGRIVNITSGSVKMPIPELGMSNGARTGLTGFVAGIARQTVARNVTINNLLPGIFDSDAQKRHIEGMLADLGKSFDQVWRERAAASPARRYGDPAEFGAYFAYLCSAQAGYITGQNLLIDGGSYPATF